MSHQSVVINWGQPVLKEEEEEEEVWRQQLVWLAGWLIHLLLAGEQILPTQRARAR